MTTSKTGAGRQPDTGRGNPLGVGTAPETTDPVRQAYDNTDWFWREVAGRALLWYAELGHEFTAYDLVGLGVPEPDDPHRWGALFRHASQQELIHCVGFAPSRRPTAAGSVARIWRGADELRQRSPSTGGAG